MTPTLAGRWQIRIFLLATFGLIIALIVYLFVKKTVPFYALLYVLLFGLVWDVIYQVITSFRWDRDWPTSYQVAAGIFEGAVLWVVMLTGKLPGIAHPPPFYIYLIEYAAIWLSIFLLTQGPLRIFSIHWRYQGGQWFMSHPKEPEDTVSQLYPAPAFQATSGGFQPVPPQVASGGFQPVPPPRASGGFQQVSPQVASGGFQAAASGGFQPAPQQVASGGFQQPSGLQPIRPSNPVHQQNLSDLAAFQPVQPLQPLQSVQPLLPVQPLQPPLPVQQPYVCVCGVTSDRQAGNFCPNCGREKKYS